MDNPFASVPAGLLTACLVVEDDSLIRLDLEETLRDFGIACVFGAATAEGALRILETSEICFAMLDFELARGNTAALAEILVARGIPAVFLTAYGPGIELPPQLRHLQVLSKPCSSAQLAEALVTAFAACGRGICCVEPRG